ncbi:MAG: 3-hydroxyacyl-CoA dehydrogenase [Castellaniella sp.]|nr:3-hydroxyacyl-CoA dehydrogenase [Castellaniella sp.]
MVDFSDDQSASGAAGGASVAVVGCGVIGAAWAAFFACRGLAVRVVDVNPGAQALLDESLCRASATLGALGLLAGNVRAPILMDDMTRALADVDHVQEALPERLDLKRAAYRDIESAVSSRCVIASSTSGILPTDLQSGMRHPERFAIAHPCNPPYLMPLVEISGGTLTSPETLDRVESFYRRLGKQTVRLRREVAGHLVNRLQAALWREAVHLVVNGYASVAEVDRAVTEGLGARWAVCGPHEIFHLSGGKQGMAGFLDRLGDAVEQWWADLGQPVLDAQTRQALVDGMEQAAGGRTAEQLAQARDEGVIAQLRAKQRR